MQYWIFYTAGVGGDGFCNLLEHADNVVPADNKFEWRIHKKQDTGNKTKFYSPNWSNHLRAHPFRRPDILVPIEQIRQSYLDIVEQNNSTVIPCHSSVYFQQIDACPYKHIVEKNQIKIHLYSLDFARVNEDLIAKTGLMIGSNGNPDRNKFLLTAEILRYYNSELFDYQVDIEQVWRNWDYFKEFVDKLGLTMDKKYYDEYFSLVNTVRN